MALRALQYEGAAVLTQVAAPVAVFDDGLADLVADMFDTMYAAKGRGLAAPQVGDSSRVFVVDTTWKEGAPQPMSFVNPAITDQSSERATGEEACLSIPGKVFAVARPKWIELRWQDLTGEAQTGRFEGIPAICICHEADHLDGLLITETGRMI